MIEDQQELEERPEILVVDDDVNTRKILKLIFSKENWNTETVGTGSEALERTKEKYFNIILLDIRLPDMKGIDIIIPLKKAFSEPIIMMMTAYASKETAVQALNMGATAYITKPFNMEDVLSKIRETFKKQSFIKERELLNRQIQQELTERKQAQRETDLLLALTKAINASPDFNSALNIALRLVIEFTGWVFGEAWILNSNKNVLEYGTPCYYSEENDHLYDFGHVTAKEYIFPIGIGLPGRVWLSMQKEWNQDVSMMSHEDFLRVEYAKKAGLRAALGVPIITDDQVLAVLVFFLTEPYKEDERMVEVISAVAEQLGTAIKKKQTEEELELNKARFETLYELSQMIDETEEDILNFVLEEGVRMTKSKIGYIYFVSEDESTLILHAWSKDVMKDCSILEKKTVYKVEETGLWGEAIRQRKAIITNDYDSAQIPNKKGYPKGHVKIKRHMNIPLFDKGKIVLLAGVGNSKEEYTESDVQQLTLIMDTMWKIIQKKKADEKLRASEASLAKAQQIAHLGSWEWNIETNDLYWSDEVFHIFGLVPDEFGATYEAFLNSVHPNDREFVNNSVNDALHENKTYDIEHRVIRPNGEERFVNERAKVFFGDSGEPILMIGTVHDITDRKMVEVALKESEQRYALAQKSADLGSWDWNIMTGNLEWSERVEPIFGYSKGEFNGTYEGFIESIHPEDKQIVIDSVNASVEEGEEYDVEHRIVWPDGTIRWISEKGDVLCDESGKAFRMLGIVQDITKRKKAEIALAHARDTLAQRVEVATRDLREEKQRIETVVETIPDGIVVIDREGKIYLVNKVFKDYYNRIYDVDFPTSLKELSLLQNPFGDIISKLFYLKTHESITIEPIKGLHLQLASSRLIVSPNTHLGVVISVRDVSPFVELDNLRKQFVSVVSHELRTPITAINLSLRNLQKFRKKISEEQLDEIINMTTDSAQVLTQMIEDLLVASRVEAGKIKLEWATYQLSNIIQGVLNVLEPRRVAKSIALKVDINTKISLYGDEKRIRQILRILVENAIKYSKKNSTVIIKAIDNYHGEFNPTAQGGTLLQVIDSGRGIPKEDIPYIFDRFFRSKDVSDKRGTGLGLSIAQEMISLHHGEISVDSKYGEGSTFSVFFPRIEK